MWSLRLGALWLVALLASASPAVDLILQNQRLYQRAIHCFLGQENCSPQLRALKEQLMQIMKDGCKECGPEVKSAATEVLNFLKEKKPGDYNKLIQKYDPDGIYRKKAEENGLQFDSS